MTIILGKKTARVNVLQKAIFTSDMHISDNEYYKIDHLHHLVDMHQPDALYLLGDIFDAWIGWDDHPDLTSYIDESFNDLSKKTHIYFMTGNRDRLLKEKDAQILHATYLPDPYVITLQNTRYLLTHGDKLCTADHTFQRMIRLQESKTVSKILKNLPLSARRAIRDLFFAHSTNHKKKLSNDIKDLSPTAITAALNDHQCQHIIHGHNHRGAITTEPYHRYNMGSWDNHQCMYLLLAGDCQLVTYPMQELGSEIHLSSLD